MNQRTKETDEGEEEKLPLSKTAQLLLEECRMVLPGIQALFGFQLIAVFNPRFAQVLNPFEQRLHLTAVGLVAVAVALIMTPAAYHRQSGGRKVTGRFIRISSWLVLWSMPALALSLCLEFYLVGQVIVGGAVIGVAAAVLFTIFCGLWFVFPHLDARKKNPQGGKD